MCRTLGTTKIYLRHATANALLASQLWCCTSEDLLASQPWGGRACRWASSHCYCVPHKPPTKPHTQPRLPHMETMAHAATAIFMTNLLSHTCTPWLQLYSNLPHLHTHLRPHSREMVMHHSRRQEAAVAGDVLHAPQPVPVRPARLLRRTGWGGWERRGTSVSARLLYIMVERSSIYIPRQRQNRILSSENRCTGYKYRKPNRSCAFYCP